MHFYYIELLSKTPETKTIWRGRSMNQLRHHKRWKLRRRKTSTNHLILPQVVFFPSIQIHRPLSDQTTHQKIHNVMKIKQQQQHLGILCRCSCKNDWVIYRGNPTTINPSPYTGFRLPFGRREKFFMSLGWCPSGHTTMGGKNSDPWRNTSGGASEIWYLESPRSASTSISKQWENWSLRHANATVRA